MINCIIDASVLALPFPSQNNPNYTIIYEEYFKNLLKLFNDILKNKGANTFFRYDILKKLRDKNLLINDNNKTNIENILHIDTRQYQDLLIEYFAKYNDYKNIILENNIPFTIINYDVLDKIDKKLPFDYFYKLYSNWDNVEDSDYIKDLTYKNTILISLINSTVFKCNDDRYKLLLHIPESDIELNPKEICDININFEYVRDEEGNRIIPKKNIIFRIYQNYLYFKNQK